MKNSPSAIAFRFCSHTLPVSYICEASEGISERTSEPAEIRSGGQNTGGLLSLSFSMESLAFPWPDNMLSCPLKRCIYVEVIDLTKRERHEDIRWDCLLRAAVWRGVILRRRPFGSIYPLFEDLSLSTVGGCCGAVGIFDARSDSWVPSLASWWVRSRQAGCKQGTVWYCRCAWCGLEGQACWS